MSKTAVISGVTGQCGFYLADYLLKQGYTVVGIVRRTSMPTDQRLEPIKQHPNFKLYHGDITDISSIISILETVKPVHEFYNLAAQSHVHLSWRSPISTADITGMGVLNCLEAVRRVQPRCRFYQASSSEMFGNSGEKGGLVLNEESPMLPESPYAVAKLFGHRMAQVYRKSYDMFVSCGILFNTDSPLRGETFVTRKITSGLAKIFHGTQEYLELGNLQAKRDWGFAGDAVRAMHMILRADEPDDFVVATGTTNTVEYFLRTACKKWFTSIDPDKVVKINPEYIRPSDVNYLLGDSSKIESKLGWKPTVSLEDLIWLMCAYDGHYYSPDPEIQKQAVKYLFWE